MSNYESSKLFEKLMKTLSSEDNSRILALLNSEGELNVTQIRNSTGSREYPTIRRLHNLESLGLVEKIKIENKFPSYRLTDFGSIVWPVVYFLSEKAKQYSKSNLKP